MRHQRKASGPRLRRTRAALAGCLVLGVGTAGTLAAWTGDEYVTGSFTAGTFGVVGSVDGSTFGEHPDAASAATLQFTLPQSTQLAPGTDVYALFAVRTTSDSVAGHLRFDAGGTNETGLGQHLRYGVRLVPGTTCDAAAYAAGGVVIPDDSLLGVSATASQPVAAAGAAPVAYCLRVTLPAGTTNAAQGTGLNASWVVTATTIASGEA